MILTAELVGLAGRSTPSVAQILGASDANNRRDHVCSFMLFHEGRMVQVVEGMRADIDRLLRRMQADLRMKGLRVLTENPIPTRRLTEAAGFCHHPVETLALAGLSDLERLTVGDVESLLELRQAA